jgi:hypothetical protein
LSLLLAPLRQFQLRVRLHHLQIQDGVGLSYLQRAQHGELNQGMVQLLQLLLLMLKLVEGGGMEEMFHPTYVMSLFYQRPRNLRGDQMMLLVQMRD